MKTGFKEPNAIKRQSPKDQPKDGKPSTWDFRCPQYDQRHSCFVNAGTHYGTGINQPVGHSGNPKSEGIPVGRVNTMRINEIY